MHLVRPPEITTAQATLRHPGGFQVGPEPRPDISAWPTAKSATGRGNGAHGTPGSRGGRSGGPRRMPPPGTKLARRRCERPRGRASETLRRPQRCR